MAGRVTGPLSGPVSDDTVAALSNLSSALWRLQELLETLTYKLEVQQLILQTGRARWLGRCTREIEVLLQQMREAELMRALDAGPACEALGLPAGTSLARLAQAAPAPWNDLLAEHRRALTQLTAELSTVSRSNSRLLADAYEAAQESLDQFDAAGGVGAPLPERPRPGDAGS